MKKTRITSSRARFKVLERPVERATRVVLQSLRKEGMIEINLVDHAVMKKNVLAYPGGKGFPRPDVKGKYLGEIFLNPDYIKRHDESLPYMLIHGILHLLGYDHKGRSDRIEMEKKEAKLLFKINDIFN